MARSPLAYAFAPGETLGRGFRRLLGQFALEARRLTRHSGGDMPQTIHYGRILIKRFRALLWLVRPALAPRGLENVKTRLRRASRILAGQRDHAVMQLTLKKLEKKGVSARDRKALTRVSQAVCWNTSTGPESDKAGRDSLQKAMMLFLASVAETEKSVSGDEAWPFSSGRVPRAFRAAHHAAKKALKSGEAVRFHEWRKKAKRLLYQLELTRLKPDQYTTRLIKKVDRLQAKLGAYHDCVVAEDTLRYKAPSRADAKRISTLLKKREGRLRKKAQKIARSIPKQPRS